MIKHRMDMKKRSHQIIVAAMADMVDEGLTVHEVFDVLEDIKNQTFPALAELSRQVKGASK